MRDYVKENIRDKCYFPCREPSGTMQMKASEDGTLYILAFDSDYSDNIGSYEVRFRVVKGKRSSASRAGASPAAGS